MKAKEPKQGSWLTDVILPVLIVLLLNLFVCRLAFVNGDSMWPTLCDRDVLLILLPDKNPEQGDIVVLRTDEDGLLHGENIVKRVIALGGQHVRIDYDENAVYVDGEKLDEPYLNREDDDPMRDLRPLTGETDLTVPEGCIFVMGDNRNHSSDSRIPQIGSFRTEDILGVKIVHLPIGRLLPEKKA